MTPYDRLNNLFRKAEEFWTKGSDLREAFGEIGSPEFWRWLNVHGVSEYEEYRLLNYPLPKQELIGRIIGKDSTVEDYRMSGITDWGTTYTCLEELGFDFVRGGRILDFGCGCARLLRLFAWHVHTCELVGVDVDDEPIEWCQENLDFAKFATIPHCPPSSFSTSHFNAIYAWSVFSHLTEDLHLQWLRELHRIASPGASIVITVQGRTVINRLRKGDTAGDIPAAVALRDNEREIGERGFFFLPYEQYFTKEDREVLPGEWDLKAYGSAFITENYIRREWSEWFDVIQFKEAPNDWQDYVLLRAR